MSRAAVSLALALLAACGPRAAPPAPVGSAARAEVAVVAAGSVSLAPVLEALAETLAPRSRVAVVAGGALVSGPTAIDSLEPGAIAAPTAAPVGPSIDHVIALLEQSAAPVRALIIVADGAANAGADLDPRITALRRAGILGYAIVVGDELGALEEIGYTTSRAVEPDGLRGAAGAIGAAIGSR